MSSLKSKQRMVRDMKKLLQKIPSRASIPGLERPTPTQWVSWFLDFYIGEAEFELRGEPEEEPKTEGLA